MTQTRTIEQDYPSAESLTLNMGPQHPSTHGVLRMMLELEGEKVRQAKPMVGYLHSGKEKLAEAKTYHKFIPYTDRLDYLQPMANNYAYVSTIEKILGIEETERCKYLRTILCELARISSHLVCIGTHVMELGAMTVFLYTFRERETLYDIFEWISGARFTVSYMRVGGVASDYDDNWLKMVHDFVDEFPEHWAEYDTLVSNNDIFVERTRGVGYISAEDAVSWCLTGASLRASVGKPLDMRKMRPYLVYDRMDFDVPTSTGGDVYARYKCRMQEMLESIKIIKQCLKEMPKREDCPINIDNPKVCYPPREDLHKSMETLIHHFLLASEGVNVPAGEYYHPIEAAKGELGFYVVSEGGYKPLRCKIRSPSFINLQSIDTMSRGELLADVVAVIGSLDLVLGEIDR